MIDFKGAQYPKEVIIYAVFFYVRYAVSYRDLEEIMAERGVSVDHSSLNRWVVRYAPQVASEAKKRKPKHSASLILSAWVCALVSIKADSSWLEVLAIAASSGDGSTALSVFMV